MAIKNDNDLDNEVYDDDDLDEDLDDVEFDVGAEGTDFRTRGRQVLGAVGRQSRARMGQAANGYKGRVADHLDDFGGRFGERISYGADYLRSNDITVIADDIVETVQRHPLVSVGVAVGAGYVAGKIIGIGNGGRKRKFVSSKVKKAVVSSLAAMAAAKLKENLTASVVDAFVSGREEFDEEIGRGRGRGRTASGRGPRSGGSRTRGRSGGRSSGRTRASQQRNDEDEF